MITTIKGNRALSEKHTTFHFELRLWINRIKFYKEQIDILQNNLDQMVKYYFNVEVMAEVEQYQNKFIVYHEVADRLIKDLKGLRNNLIEDKDYESKFHTLQAKAEGFIKFVDDLKCNFLYFYTSHYISDNHALRK
jgi:hypothetical protein